MKINTRLLAFFLISSALFASTAYAQDQKENLAGKATYDQYCSVCHASGLAGAPKFQDKNAWEPRLAAKGINGLVKDSVTGLNGVMPPQGSCSTCTEQQLKDAIEYMLPPK